LVPSQKIFGGRFARRSGTAPAWRLGVSIKLVSVVSATAIVLLALWINNSSLLTKSPAGRPLLLAHRGVAQQFPIDGVMNDTCTATRIYPPRNKYIEDTIPSMEEAFKDGADIVEFDIHPTTDGQWAVFHDWTLDCRTDGHGVTRTHSLAYLKTLDVGYGYTADGGRTFPLRGEGVGLMPSLDEVLNTFPDRSFLIHIKSNDPKEGAALSAKLRELPAMRLQRLMVHGGNRPIAVVRSQLPSVPTMSPKLEKRCVVSYLGVGWSGYVPTTCRNSILLIPENVGPWLWGWPIKFVERMHHAGTSVFLTDRLTLDDFKAGRTQGLNRLDGIRTLPKGYSGGIWTGAIEIIGPALRQRH
jgi:glycerophosphoryl diester phosphodiesterase